MAKAREVRGWTVEPSVENTLIIRKGKRPPLIMSHELGMSDEVLDEFIATRTIEAELADHGASGYDVTEDGRFVLAVDPETGEETGTRGTASQKLIDEYVEQVSESRFQQLGRERRRRRQERD